MRKNYFAIMFLSENNRVLPYKTNVLMGAIS